MLLRDSAEKTRTKEKFTQFRTFRRERFLTASNCAKFELPTPSPSQHSPGWLGLLVGVKSPAVSHAEEPSTQVQHNLNLWRQITEWAETFEAHSDSASLTALQHHLCPQSENKQEASVKMKIVEFCNKEVFYHLSDSLCRRAILPIHDCIELRLICTKATGVHVPATITVLILGVIPVVLHATVTDKYPPVPRSLLKTSNDDVVRCVVSFYVG